MIDLECYSPIQPISLKYHWPEAQTKFICLYAENLTVGHAVPGSAYFSVFQNNL